MSIHRLDNIESINEVVGEETHNPLVTLVDLSKSEPGAPMKVQFELFGIFLKESHCNPIKYGKKYYDYQKGTMVFVSPGQVVDIEEVDENGLHQPTGLVLFFHPDLVKGTSLASSLIQYSFFSYRVNEALHLSEQEKLFVIDIFSKIESEIKRPIDKHSKKLITNTIELLLNYCQRFYDRQFITREIVNRNTVEKFDRLLNEYFENKEIATVGIPRVSYFAEKLNISVKYFGDLIKKETGQTAKDFIQNKTIEMAKSEILISGKTISEVAYQLGFKYPQHFTRLFKQREGISPIHFKYNHHRN